MGRPDGSWFWVVEPDETAPHAVRAGDGRVLTRRDHGSPARVIVRDTSGASLPIASYLRVAASLPAASHVWRVDLAPDGTPGSRDGDRITVCGPWVATRPTRHPVDAELQRLAGRGPALRVLGASPPVQEPTLEDLPCPDGPARRVLFFESLMNSEMPHNEAELSQGVLHMASTLTGTGSEVVLANVKMSITDPTQRHLGMDSLEHAIAGGPIELVCITLLEGYWAGVVELVEALRRLGCRAHVAVGGVMASLAPEASAAHLPDVSFVCRGAGEYFVPRLARILGPGASIDRPLSESQLAALASMRGLVAIDRVARTVVCARSSETVVVDDLDAVELDLDLLAPRHLVNGVEISTARGCIHKCSFCSILGRQSYQARTAPGVLALLERYEARFRALFGDDPPTSVHRLHISDDDFACDKPRAAAFLRAIVQTRFRLSSFQVSVADLCRRVDGVLLAEPDPAIVDAIVPECFADATARVLGRDYVADHRSRSWSAYLQIGVETFSENELRRLGKGYRREHVRAMVGVLAGKRIHVDAYFIASNAETTLDDLVSSVEEVCRLKLRHPEHFHVRFPIVPRLVSYATSASHRRMVLRGETDRMVVRAHARVPSHPEMDYVFVEQDESADPRVEEAVAAGFFTDERRYTASLDAIARIVRAGHERASDPALAADSERALRRLDDLPRRLVFDMLRDQHASAGARGADPLAIASAEAVLGPSESWRRALKRYLAPRTACLAWAMPASKRDDASRAWERSLDLLLSSERPRVVLRLLEPAPTEAALAAIASRTSERRIELVVRASDRAPSSASLAAWPLEAVTLEVELAQTADPGALQRVLEAIGASAPRGPARIEALLRVPAIDAGRVSTAFFALAGAGARRIRLAPMRDRAWSAAESAALAAGLLELGEELRRRWRRGEDVDLLRLEAPDGEAVEHDALTVGPDGTLYAGVVRQPRRDVHARVGHLDDLRNFDRYVLDGATGPAESGPPSPQAERVLSSFLAWMRQQAQASAEAATPEVHAG